MGKKRKVCFVVCFLLLGVFAIGSSSGGMFAGWLTPALGILAMVGTIGFGLPFWKEQLGIKGKQSPPK